MLPESFSQFSQNLFGFLPLSRGRLGAELPHPLVNRGQFHNRDHTFLRDHAQYRLFRNTKNMIGDHSSMANGLKSLLAVYCARVNST